MSLTPIFRKQFMPGPILTCSLQARLMYNRWVQRLYLAKILYRLVEI
jgi:hypothetical protein